MGHSMPYLAVIPGLEDRYRPCPECGGKNAATAKDCCKCGADLRKVKRVYTGKKKAYYISWIDLTTGRRKSETCGPDKVYAQNQAAKKLQELLSGDYTGLIPVSYDDFVREHLENIDGHLSRGSSDEHERTLKQFQAACNPASVSEIDFPMIERFRNCRTVDGVSPATVNKCLRTLQGILESAVQRKYLRENPFKENRKRLFVKEPEIAPNPLEPVEFDQVFNVCDDYWKNLCLMGYYTGMRIDEILALRWEDIDFKGKMIAVKNTPDHRTKSRKIRYLPMSKVIEAALTKLHRNRLVSDKVFSPPMTVLSASKGFVQIVINAGLVDSSGKHRFTFHNLRDSFCSNLLQSGVDLKTVSELAGHASITTTTKHYIATKAKTRIEAIEKMSLMINAG